MPHLPRRAANTRGQLNLSEAVKTPAQEFHLGLLHPHRHIICRLMRLGLQALLLQAGGQRRVGNCADTAGHLLQQKQLRWQHGLPAGPMLRRTQPVARAWPAVERKAQDVGLDSQLFGAIMPSHVGNIVCLQFASRRCLWLMVLLASAGPQLTGAARHCLGLQLGCPESASTAGGARFVSSRSGLSPFVSGAAD